MACGAVDQRRALEEALAAADLVFLSQTIGRILDTIRHIDPLLKPGALVTDAGSTKCEIVDVARQSITRGQFLGGHPMAGKETRGAAAAEAESFPRTDLGADARRTGAELRDACGARISRWLDRIGARIVVLDADEHDRVVS